MPEPPHPSLCRIQCNKLRRLRVAKGLSRRALARRIGVPSGTIDNAENGKRVSFSTAAAIAEAFRVPTNDLIDLADDATSSRPLVAVPPSEESAGNHVTLVDDESCLIIKAQLQIEIPKNGTVPPQVYALIELLKRALPDGAGTKIVSIIPGAVFVACADSDANALELNDSDFRDEARSFIRIQSVSRKDTSLASLKAFNPQSLQPRSIGTAGHQTLPRDYPPEQGQACDLTVPFPKRRPLHDRVLTTEQLAQLCEDVHFDHNNSPPPIEWDHKRLVTAAQFVLTTPKLLPGGRLCDMHTPPLGEDADRTALDAARLVKTLFRLLQDPTREPIADQDYLDWRLSPRELDIFYARVREIAQLRYLPRDVLRAHEALLARRKLQFPPDGSYPAH